MPASVSLLIREGPFAGQTFVFEEPRQFLIGRGHDCNLRLPSDPDHAVVSRHHCQLEIDPPEIRVRDFGSLNGTIVNGENIGHRQRSQKPEEVERAQRPAHQLKHGDSIQLGATVMQVVVRVPTRCAQCAAELSEDKTARHDPARSGLLCDRCWAERAKNPPTGKKRSCARCGGDVSGELGALLPGEYVCERCRAHPEELRAILDYDIERLLGQGGLGAVYLARHKTTGEYVALKVMLPHVALDATAQRSFLREIENTAALNHPNIVAIRQAGSMKGMFFCALELCNGGSVDRLLRHRGGRLTLAESWPILSDVLDGLEYAHNAPIPNVKLANRRTKAGRGLVHRDLTPHNILLVDSEDQRVAKISDFGLSKAFDLAGLTGFTRTGEIAGKPLYVPRQQAQNFRYTKPEADVWAAAASFYKMLTGCVPREFPPGEDVWQVVMRSVAVPIRQRHPSLPARLAAVIDAALVDTPEIGFKSAAAFKTALLETGEVEPRE